MASVKTQAKKGISKKGEIYLQLKSNIISHRLKAGRQLTEEEIVGQNSISRTPVREIFRKPEHDGLIKHSVITSFSSFKTISIGGKQLYELNL